MKTNRRRAIHCELIEPSKTSPGYYKYQITIRELDGSQNIVPAYGKDMQDAIERLLWNERVETVMDKKATIPIFVILGLAIVILSGSLSVVQNNPLWILAGAGSITAALFAVNRIDSYLKK
jgi:hypothetical protein